jgi:hypothetical protein
MPGKDLNYRITVDQSAGTSGIRDFSRTVTSELRKVDQSLDDTATASQKAAQTLTKMADAAEVELRAASAAAQALAQALGPEMAAKLGQNGIAQAVGDLNRMGVAFSDIEADADSLAAAMKRVDEVQVSAADAGMGNLNGKLNDTNDAAVKAKNSLANMFGNVSQDASSLFGNLGSLGVGIGQLAEGTADAALGGQKLTSALASTAALAGPIAALGIVMAAVGNVQSRFGDSAKRTADDVAAWSDALTAGGNAATNYAKHLKDLGSITLDVTRTQNGLENTISELNSHWYTTGIGVRFLADHLGLADAETKDLTATLGKAGLTAEQFARFVTAGAGGAQALATVLHTTSLSADEQADVLKLLGQRQADYATATATSAAVTKVFGDDTDKAADTTERQARALERSKQATDDLITSVDAEADARQRSIDALKDQADALNAQADAAQSAADQQLDVQDAMVKFGEVLKDHKATTDEVRDAAIDLAKAQAELSTKQAAAAGVTQTATAKLDAQNDALLSTAAAAKGPARSAILDYVGAVNQIPPEKMTEIQAAIDAGDLDTANRLLAEASKTRTATINADAHTSDAEQKIDDLTRQRYLDIYFRYKNTQVPVRSPTGGGGAPIPQLAPVGRGRGVAAPAALGVDADAPVAAAAFAGGAIVSPFVVDVGVAAVPMALTLDMRGSILGSRYDVTRTVRSAVRDGIRLAGTRGLTP